jgi:hypothetical protein
MDFVRNFQLYKNDYMKYRTVEDNHMQFFISNISQYRVYLSQH